MVSNTLRTCKDCGLQAHTEEELQLFVRSRSCLHGRKNKCKKCSNEYGKRHQRGKGSGVFKAYQAKYRYSITLEEYNECMSTSSTCKICDTEENLCYDHDHETMKFRGVLCQKCNKGLGCFGDDLNGLRKAVNYLEEHYGK